MFLKRLIAYQVVAGEFYVSRPIMGKRKEDKMMKKSLRGMGIAILIALLAVFLTACGGE